MSITKVLCLVGCLLTACLGGYASRADPAEIRTLMLFRGILCHETIQVERLLTEMALNSGKSVEGCGRVVGPIIAKVSPVGWYNLPTVSVLIASFDIEGKQTHFGWVAIKETAAPAVTQDSLL